MAWHMTNCAGVMDCIHHGVAKLVCFGFIPLGGSWKVLDTDSINFVFVGRLGFLCLMETRVSCWLKPAKKCLDFWPLPFKVINSASWHKGVSVKMVPTPPLVGRLTELTLHYEGGGVNGAKIPYLANFIACGGGEDIVQDLLASLLSWISFRKYVLP